MSIKEHRVNPIDNRCVLCGRNGSTRMSVPECDYESDTTKPTSEFDQVFEDLEAPEYPATCDQCGAEGTNASMENHTCNEPPAPRAGERRGDLVLEAREFVDLLQQARTTALCHAVTHKADFFRSQELIRKLADEVVAQRNAVDFIINALRAAKEHLEYCGYGDSWERECATTSGLPQLIDDALATIEREEV